MLPFYDYSSLLPIYNLEGDILKASRFGDLPSTQPHIGVALSLALGSCMPR